MKTYKPSFREAARILKADFVEWTTFSPTCYFILSVDLWSMIIDQLRFHDSSRNRRVAFLHHFDMKIINSQVITVVRLRMVSQSAITVLQSKTTRVFTISNVKRTARLTNILFIAVFTNKTVN